MQAGRKIKALEIENASLKEEVEQLKSNYAKLEVQILTIIIPLTCSKELTRDIFFAERLYNTKLLL